MYNLNYKNIKKENFAGYIVLFFGLVFLITMSVLLISSKNQEKKMDSWVMSYDVIVDNRRNNDGDLLYSPVYLYKVNGVEYECYSNASSSVYPNTDNKVVYYEKDNPGNCVSAYTKSADKIIQIFLIIPVILIGVSIYLFMRTYKRINEVKELNQRGKLIKGLTYRFEPSGIVINGTNIPRPVIDYVLPTGETKLLKGEPRYDYRTGNFDSTIDLLIDENNPDIYFMDFNITEKSLN